MPRTIKIALIGAGMFGGDVHLRAYADMQRSGLAGFLGRLGQDGYSRPLADVEFELAAVATRSERSALRAADEYATLTGARPATFHGPTPWAEALEAFPDLDVLAVCTPDHLHMEPVLAALSAGCHVLVEKPLCLATEEADRIIELAEARQRVVCVDMHKRFDPDHMRIRNDIRNRIGEPLYGTAVLEEPLEVSIKHFPVGHTERPVQLCRPALGGPVPLLLWRKAGRADGSGPETAADPRWHRRL